MSLIYTFIFFSEGFIEVPSSKTLKYSKLQFFYPKTTQQRPSFPSSFAWLTEESIFYGQVHNLFKQAVDATKPN